MSKSLSKSRFIELFSESPKARLADTCKLINGDRGKNYPSSNDRVESGIPFINAGNLNGKNIDFSGMEYITEEKYSTLKTGKVQKGDILYCLRGSLGKIGLVDFDEGLIASSLVIIRCDQNKLLPDFLLCALGSNEVKQQLLKANNGSSQPNLSAASVKEYKVTCPSINEQKEFSEFIKQIDKSKFILQKMIEKLELLKKSRFIEMFGDPNSNAKGYDKKPLRDLFALQMGKTPPRKEMKYWTDATNKWISISDMSTYDKYTTDTKEKIADCAISDTGIKVVPKNTVIMSFKLSIGKTAITSEDIYTNEAIMAFVKKNEKINNSFLSYALKMVDWTSTSSNAVKGVTLNKEIIGNKDFFIPPIELQNEFEKFSNQVDKSKLILQKQLDDLVGETK